MKTPKLIVERVLVPRVLVLALMAAFGAAHADDGELDALTKPTEASVSMGWGSASGSAAERAAFGQYNGLSRTDNVLLLDFLQVQREEETGLWTRVEGRKLGADDRELSLSREKQGDWKIGFDYSELNRRDPLTLNTGMQGIGSTAPTASLIAVGAGANVNLDLKRTAYGFQGSKWLSPHLTLELTLRSEDKVGTRLSGVGGYCSNAISPICAGANTTVAALFLLPEPVNSTTQQIEGELHYADDKLSLTGGYYGSFYNNARSTVALGGVGGVLGAGATQALLAANLAQPVALAPDNQAHQVYLSGNYAIEPGTRVNFKLAYTHATQQDSFGSLGVGNLDAVVDTTLAQTGLSTKISKALTVNLSGRYEEKKDGTHLGNYLVDSAGNLYTNSPENSVRMHGKAEALYQFSSVYRGALAVDYDFINRNRPVASTYIPSTSLAALRERTNEVGVRAEVRRSMSESVNASVSLAHSDRDGYRWYALSPTTGFPFLSYAASNALTGTFPMTMVDRSRDSAKLSADWSASEALSIQASYEQGVDTYHSRNSAGMNSSDVNALHVDASYKLNDAWSLTGFASVGNQGMKMRQYVGYTASLTSYSTNLGLGASGKLSSKLEVGTQLSYAEDRNHYSTGATPGTAAAEVLPEENFRNTTLQIYGKYAISKASQVHVELVHQERRVEAWNWMSGGVPFSYSDNSTVAIQPDQQVTYLGVKYVYRFK